MIFGPLSESDQSRLIGILDQKRIHYEITDSKIEISDSLLAQVEDELVQIGLLSPIVEEELDHEEFLCTECDYISTSPGTCPKHALPLLDYSSWVAAQSGQPMDRRVVFVLLLVAAAVAGYYLISHH